MSNVRFQLKHVNGKSQILFGDDVTAYRKVSENQNKEKKKFSYKTRDQRFPIRGKAEPVEPPPSKPPGRPSGAARTGPGPGAAASRKPRQGAGPGAKKASGGDTVTLTQEQLQLILSSVGKTAASDRDNSVRISVDRTDGGLSIEAQSSPRHVGGDRRYARQPADEDDDSALGDSDAEEERPPPGRRARPQPVRSGGENILGLLAKGGGSKEAARPPPKRSQPPASKAKPKAAPQPSKKGGRAEGPSEEANPDLDERMRKIIAENKSKLKESELVDLLAAVYMDERKKQLGLNEESDVKTAKGKSRGRKDDSDDDDPRGPRQREARRNYRDVDDEDEDDGARRKGRRRDYEDEDEGARRKGRRREEEERQVRRGGRRVRYDDEEEEEEEEDEVQSRHPGTKGRYNSRRRHYDDEEEEESEDERRGGRNRGRRGEREDEEEGGGRRKVEAPKFLTKMEKKRLQWEKEKGELEERNREGKFDERRRGRSPDDVEEEKAGRRKGAEQPKMLTKMEKKRLQWEKEKDEASDRRRGKKADDRRRERRNRSPEEEEPEEEEEEEAARKEGETPKFLTAVEKKRLKWELDREENAKIEDYNPWNKPGAGAPPKDYFSNVSAAMTKKEEDQQRYARELDAQRRERDQMLAGGTSDRRGGARGGAEESPRGQEMGTSLSNSGTFARGRGFANLDEKTIQEVEERRKRQMEHQEAIKKQVEEVQSKRAQERQRRIEEEQREEARLKRERDNLQLQYEEEQLKAKRREAEQASRLVQLQAANEAAEQAAKFEKARRRLHHLETSGHDTSGLRASLEAQLTSRSQASGTNAPAVGSSSLGLAGGGHHVTIRHAAVPGLEGIAEVSDSGHGAGTGRWATPREVRVTAPKFDLPSAREDLQVQTDASLLEPMIQRAVEMAIASTAQVRDLPVRHPERSERQYTDRGARPPVARKMAEGGPKYERGFVTKQEKPSARPAKQIRARQPLNKRPIWGAANPQGRRTLAQSDREIAPWKRQDRQERRARRQAELMAEVEANLNRLPGAAPPRRRQPDENSPRLGPNWAGPETDAGGPLGTYNLEEGNQPRTGRLTPPLPSRRRLDNLPVGTSRSDENVSALGRAALPTDGALGIVRTSEILNPAAAERPLQVSRENTERQLARKTYMKSLNPAQFGEHMANLDDHRMEQGLIPRNNAKNPIFNPGIVKDIPTPRQDAILQHLSDIRKNLLLKQREIETSLSLSGNV